MKAEREKAERESERELTEHAKKYDKQNTIRKTKEIYEEILMYA